MNALQCRERRPFALSGDLDSFGGLRGKPHASGLCVKPFTLGA
jgi:hypothetical protein